MIVKEINKRLAAWSIFLSSLLVFMIAMRYPAISLSFSVFISMMGFIISYEMLNDKNFLLKLKKFSSELITSFIGGLIGGLLILVGSENALNTPSSMFISTLFVSVGLLFFYLRFTSIEL
ncbi:hypothetical protein J4417_03235 [Candidatus Woesearchaeota archaeon]|nr:hypothetical protein [Candidatus Woesearchaeota archaeon]